MILFSLAGSPDPASHTAQPESDLERMMTATSGRKCLEQFERSGRAGLWARTFAALLVGMEGWYSTKCRLIWKLKGTRYSRLYFQLVPSMRPTGEIGYGLSLLKKPAKFDNSGSLAQEMMCGFRMLPTPNKSEANKYTTKLNQNSQRGTSLHCLAVNGLLPTPKKREASHCKAEAKRRTPSMESLAAMGLLPTPTKSSDQKGGCTRTDPERQNDTLAHAIHGIVWETGKTSQLNPRFVEEMMGFPEGWTELPFLSGESSPLEPTVTQ